MKLDTRREKAIHLVRLGMSREDALVLAGCNPEELETLLDEEVFTSQARIAELEEEKSLLLMHTTAIKEQVIRGSTAGLQWKLSKINPRRWGEAKVDDHDGAVKVEFYIPDNGRD